MGSCLAFKRKYDTISDEDRLKLILLIKDFGMSCHKASRVLGIAYNNAKVIFRIYKNEQRIKQTPKQHKRHAKTIRADQLKQRQLARQARVNALIDEENSSADTFSDFEDERISSVNSADFLSVNEEKHGRSEELCSSKRPVN